MDMRTPLSRVQGLGSAKSGTGHFIQQRVTALANIPLAVFLLWFVAINAGRARADILVCAAHPLVATGLALAIVSIVWHMRLGLQMVIEDYVHKHGCRMALLLANSFFTAGLAVVGLVAIVKLVSGA